MNKQLEAAVCSFRVISIHRKVMIDSMGVFSIYQEQSNVTSPMGISPT